MPSVTPRALRGVAAALGVAAAAACSTSNPMTGGQLEGIQVVSGGGVTDTAAAPLPLFLVAEVRDKDGEPMAGVSVQFEAAPATLNGVAYPCLLFAVAGATTSAPLAAAQTDVTGRAAVRVTMGRVAGSAMARISVPTLGYNTTATYTVNPGTPTRVSLQPADTAVYAGASYTLRTVREDRWGNAIAGTPAVATAAGAVVTVSGATVTGVAEGRAQLTATAGAQSFNAAVSVVPRGTLLAVRPDGLYAFDLDGTGYRRVISTPGARSPRWMPGGNRFVYNIGLEHAYTADLAGANARLFPTSQFQGELWLHVSRDGEWIYFGGYAGPLFRGYPYRVHPDGTGLTLVPFFVPDDTTQGHPSPSPNNERVATFREVGNSRNVMIRVLNMRTGRVEADNVPGHTPEWSHGDSIVYLDSQGNTSGPLRLMAPNGEGRRIVSNGSYGFGYDWSPDDRWIVARDVVAGRLELVERATGLRIPLPFTTGLSEPSWKP